LSRRTLAVLLSVILAMIGTTAVYLYLNSADSRAIAGKRARVVLVAAKRIPAGTTGEALRSGSYLRAVRMPAETLPDDALPEIGSELASAVATADVQRGQLLLRAMFDQRVAAGPGVAIPEGMVAVAARMKAFTFSPGLIAVGSKVAIFYTYTPVDEAHRDSASGSGLEKQHATNSVTRLLLNDVEVVAVSDSNGTTTDAPGTKAKRQTSGSDNLVVTVALDQLDAERLAHAVAIGGELNVAMLGEASKVKPDAGIDNRTLFS
jgi:pilus assembly protein CpaB